jgi:hypothetical protein
LTIEAVQVWLWVSIVFNVLLGVVILIGSIWSAFREIYIRDMERGQREVARVTQEKWERIYVFGDQIVAGISAMSNLTKEQKSEIINQIKEQARLSLDIEGRLERSIRDSREFCGSRANVTVQNSSGGGAANQAGDNKASRL